MLVGVIVVVVVIPVGEGEEGVTGGDVVVTPRRRLFTYSHSLEKRKKKRYALVMVA